MIYIYSSYATMSYTVATTTTPLRPISQQLICHYDLYVQLLRNNDTYCLNNYYSGSILQQLLCLHDLYLQPLRHYEPYCRNNYYVTKALYHSNSYVITTYIYNSTTPWYILSQQLLLRPYITATTMSPWSISIALTSLWSILSQPLLRH